MAKVTVKKKLGKFRSDTLRKKKPQDATLRNVRAATKRTNGVKARLDKVEAQVAELMEFMQKSKSDG